MPKLVMIIVAVVIVSVSMCYTANRICNTIDRKAGDLSIQHDAMMDVLNEVRITARDTNDKVSDTNGKVSDTNGKVRDMSEKITFLYNMVRNQNPDLKPTTERNK